MALSYILARVYWQLHSPALSWRRMGRREEQDGRRGLSLGCHIYLNSFFRAPLLYPTGGDVIPLGERGGDVVSNICHFSLTMKVIKEGLNCRNSSAEAFFKHSYVTIKKGNERESVCSCQRSSSDVFFFVLRVRF